MPNFTVVAVKMWAYSPQNRKKWYFFGINLPLRYSFRGSTKKVNITNTNLPASNDTVIVLKTTLLHSVFVITNFVIPKHDRQKNHTFSSTAGA